MGDERPQPEKPFSAADGLPAMWVSAKTRRRFQAVAIAVLAVGATLLFEAVCFNEGNAEIDLKLAITSTVLVVAGLYALDFLKKMHGEPFCNFCGRLRQQVGKLCAGPNVAICDDCTATSFAVIHSVGTQDALVRSLAERAAEQKSQVLLRAARVLVRDLDDRLMVADSALVCDHPQMALELLADWPESDRRDVRTLRALALDGVGRSNEALELLRSRESDLKTQSARGEWLADLARLEIRAQGVPAMQALEHAEEALRTLDGEAAWHRALAHGALAQALLALGRHREVVERVRGFQNLGGTLTPTAWLALGDAYDKLSQGNEARAFWTEALSAPSDRTISAREAKSRLAVGDQSGGPYRTPG